ncbi:MAG: hypothetical protein ACFFDY_01700 [Candidatus Thorarchaeota archaeon]
MTEVSEQQFLNRVCEVVFKLSKIVKTQSPRFKRKWDEYLGSLNKQPHIVRQITLEEDRFIKEIEYRISVLKNVEQATLDGFHSVKTLLQTLYGAYIDSDLFKNDFSVEDQVILKYFIAKEILGNLIQYNKLDHESVPLKYNIIARNYTLIKLKGQSDIEILDSLNKLNIKDVKMSAVVSLMKEIESDGIITIKKKGESYQYTLKKELELSKEGKLCYSQVLQPLVDFPTLFFRSFFNIRELNITLDRNVKYHDFLQNILLKTATQGFAPTNYVFKNLVKYYEKIRDESE